MTHNMRVASEEIERSGSVDRYSPAETLDSPDALAARLALSGARDLVVLIAGNGTGQALAAALETARRLSSDSPTLLVDLGATQDWFADILDRQGSCRTEIAGFADLIAERASFSEVIWRDLSTKLDVIPSGGIVDRDALNLVFAALASSYSRLVLHASDWRAPAAVAAAEIADFVVIVAPPARLRRYARRFAPIARRRRRRGHWICGAAHAVGLRRGRLNGRGAGRRRPYAIALVCGASPARLAIRSMKSSDSASTSFRTDTAFGSPSRSSFASPWTVLQISAEILDGSLS